MPCPSEMACCAGKVILIFTLLGDVMLGSSGQTVSVSDAHGRDSYYFLFKGWGATCDSNNPCGFESSCINGSCTCSPGFSIHPTDANKCRNESCQDPDCLQCSMSPSSCTKCARFMSSQAPICLQKCEGSSEQIGDDYICNESSDDENEVDIVVAVVAGVGAGLILCILVILIVCIYLRKTRKKINLQNQSYRAHNMEVGSVKQYPMYDNSGFESDSQVDPKQGKIDPLHYANELDKLRPYADTLMALLSQVKGKTRGMNSSDPRVPTYKGVIHQLCRVLVLIHKKDPVVSIPSDALSLIQWAHQMLDDHREQQSSSGGTGIQPIAQISSVDLDAEVPTSPVYATPEDSISPHQSPLSQMLATPYSSVPVPVTTADSSIDQRRLSGKKSGFATISRTPSIPNGDFLKTMGEEHSSSDTFPPEEREVRSSSFKTFTQPQPSGFRKEDFQSFLIDKSNLPEDDTVVRREKKDKTNANTVERRLSKHKPPPEIFNTSSESYGDVDFSGPNVTQQTSSKAHQTSTSSNEVGKASSSVKKNIITNPNAIKKANAMNGHSSKLSISTPNIGYFANGHYYDPNPIGHRESDPDVYAPGSSYSDRSNVMSTFLGDAPLSRSSSSTDPSDDENCDSDNSGGDLDVFPFDPKEATNPVEV